MRGRALPRAPLTPSSHAPRVTSTLSPHLKGETDMFFEHREYRTKPGQRDRWVKYMEEVIIPFQASKGMVIVGSFVGQEEDDLYLWIRRFESDEDLARLREAVYESDTWKNEIAPPISEMLDRDRMKITRIEPTQMSVIR